MDNTALKKGYIALFVITVINFIYKILFTISGTHIGVNASGFWGKLFDFIGDPAYELGDFWGTVYAFIAVIIMFIISAIVFLVYRKYLSKSIVVIVFLMFLFEFLGQFLAMLGAMPSLILFTFLTFIYPIAAIAFMAKGIRYLSYDLEE